MMYLGGKARIAKDIVSVLNEYRKPNQLFVEPFVGAANIISRMNGERHAYDNHRELIELYRALQSGWIPPSELTEQESNALKTEEKELHLKAFAGFGCSFGGKYFGGYARNNRGRNYCGDAKRTLLRAIAKMQNVKFGCKDYRDIEYNNALIYCDPPYEKTTKYTTGSFDSNTFWQWCRDMQARGNTVIVSEYKAPDDFECIWSKNVKLGLRTKNGCEVRVEKLFTPMAQTIR